MLRTLAVGMAVCIALAVSAQQQGVLFSEDFEEDTTRFFTLDRQAEREVTQEGFTAHGGTGWLQIKYMQRAATAGPQQQELPGSIVLMLRDALPELRSISFAISSKLPTEITVAVIEGLIGSRYTKQIWCQGGKWQEFTLPLDGFVLDRTGPPDSDGKLTPDRVRTIAIADASSFTRAAAERSPVYYVSSAQEQVLRIDDFKLLSTAPPEKPAAEGVVVITGYESPADCSVFLGGKDISVTPVDGEGDSRALRIDYTVPADTMMRAMHPVSMNQLAGVTAIRLRLKSNHDLMIGVVVDEMRGDGADDTTTYQAIVNVPESETWQTVSIPLSQFKPIPGSPDPNGRLDAELIGAVSLLDASGLLDGTDTTSTLWLDELAGVKD